VKRKRQKTTEAEHVRHQATNEACYQQYNARDTDQKQHVLRRQKTTETNKTEEKEEEIDKSKENQR